MPTLQLRTTLTAQERAERHRLIARDSVALSTLVAIALALTFVTYSLFHSFSAYRAMLEQRWKARGETALHNGQPQRAIEGLRSALAYAPDDRGLQVELATALAAAGRIPEALVYFNTLHESQPGDGRINLQLARLAARQNNVSEAIEDYQAALDGTWNGDGVLRRREVRLELSRYLIAQHRYDEARNQLLIAAGNAADNHALQLTAAGLLEQADGDTDAFTLYRKAMAYRDTRTAGLIGAGRTAAARNRYLTARNLLEQATGQVDFLRLPEDERNAVHTLLEEANQLLVLYPSMSLMPHQRALRVSHDAEVAQARLRACAAPAAGTGSAPKRAAAGASPGPTETSAGPPEATPGAGAPGKKDQSTGALHSALGAVERARESLVRVVPGSSAPQSPQEIEAAGAARGTLAALAVRWQPQPTGPELVRQMERDPALLQTVLQLVYDTEKTTAQLCGPPSGEDALLLKIAAAPDEIEEP